MKGRRAISACLVVQIASVFLVGPAPAAADLESAAQAFVGENGFQPQEIAQLAETMDKLVSADPRTMLRGDADVSGIEKALLLLEEKEKPLARVRYIVRYRERRIGDVTLSLIEALRYNLGPAIRAETIEAYGEQNTDGPEAFGVGPHVGWRFTTIAGTKASAMLVAAGRKEVGEAEARTASCMARTCLSLELLDDYAVWSQLTRPVAEVETAYSAMVSADLAGELVTDQAPAYVALELAVAAGMADAQADEISWTIEQRQGAPTQEHLFAIVIDRNLGQEVMTDAALGIPKLKKEGAERWFRRTGGIFEGRSAQSYARANGPFVKRSADD